MAACGVALETPASPADLPRRPGVDPDRLAGLSAVLGELARLASRCAGQLHRDIAGEIAMLWVARALELHEVEIEVGRQYAALEFLPRLAQQLQKFVFHGRDYRF